MRVCRRLSDNRIIEAQSGDGGLEVLRTNARTAGYRDGEFTVLEMADDAFAAALKAQNDADFLPERTRADAFRADSERIDLIGRLKTASPAQIRGYVNASITDLASAKAMLARILILIALDVRN